MKREHWFLLIGYALGSFLGVGSVLALVSGVGSKADAK